MQKTSKKVMKWRVQPKLKIWIKRKTKNQMMRHPPSRWSSQRNKIMNRRNKKMILNVRKIHSKTSRMQKLNQINRISSRKQINKMLKHNLSNKILKNKPRKKKAKRT